MRRFIDPALLGVALLLLAVGAYLGLVATPPERVMGDVYRIMYVHVPSATAALIAFTLTFVASVAYLLKGSLAADALAEATAEIGVLFTTLLLVTGSIWGRPTWGVWWTWDPRLTTAAIMWLAFIGYLALRRFVDAPERRATWAAVTAIIVSVDIPIVWFSVKWWNSLHQMQSSSKTVDPEIARALGFNSLAFLMLLAWFVLQRYRIGRMRQHVELSAPPAVEPAAEGGVA